uniref:Uncharacterized protein n=1 Tax=Caenorhabditis japonica TaxID=281687 RepID=A0A8R1EFA1_CAEJA
MIKKAGAKGKKRLAKNKMAPKAKKGVIQKKKMNPSVGKSESSLEHKTPVKPEAPPTTTMELRTGTRKSYC